MSDLLKSYIYAGFPGLGQVQDMGEVIPSGIFGLEGQVIKEVVISESSGRVRIVCNWNRHCRPVDHRTGRRGSVNRLLRRTALDVPLCGRPCEVEIEYAIECDFRGEISPCSRLMWREKHGDTELDKTSRGTGLLLTTRAHSRSRGKR